MRYIVGLLIAVGLGILGIILLFRFIFGGGSTVPPKTQLLTYANTNVVMRLTIDGPINVDQDHRRIQIDVGSGNNEVRFMTGYQGNIVKAQTFDSNPTAYSNFLRAIDLQGFTKGDDSKGLADERGYCPTGYRYIYEIVDGSTTKQRYWTTSCNQVKSFQGNSGVINTLFKAQVADYEQQIPTNFGIQ